VASLLPRKWFAIPMPRCCLKRTNYRMEDQVTLSVNKICSQGCMHRRSTWNCRMPGKVQIEPREQYVQALATGQKGARVNKRCAACNPEGQNNTPTHKPNTQIFVLCHLTTLLPAPVTCPSAAHRQPGPCLTLGGAAEPVSRRREGGGPERGCQLGSSGRPPWARLTRSSCEDTESESPST